jgi:hypothetical protein
MASRKEEIRMQRLALRFLSSIFMASEHQLSIGSASRGWGGGGAGGAGGAGGGGGGGGGGDDASTGTGLGGGDASVASGGGGGSGAGGGETTGAAGSDAGGGATNGTVFPNGAFAAVSPGPTLLLPSVDEFLRGSAAQNRSGEAANVSIEYTTNAIRLAGKKYQYTRRPPVVMSSVGATAPTEAVAKKRHGERLKAWQKDALAKGLHRGRLFLSAQSSYPVLCYSVMNYDASTERAAKRKRDILKSREAQGLAGLVTVGRKGRVGVSYIDLLGGDRGCAQMETEAEEGTVAKKKAKKKNKDVKRDDGLPLLGGDVGKKKRKSKDGGGSASGSSVMAAAEGAAELNKGMAVHYDPNFLDDGMIKQGKSRLITSGPSYRQSFLPYVKRRQLKDEINAQFRELHPWLPTSMSLSKIRTLKQESLEQWKKFDLELSTLALGIVYFERLVIKTLVMKTNRKLKFAACLLLAFKFNEGSLNELELAEAQAAAEALINHATQAESKTAMSAEKIKDAGEKIKRNKKNAKTTWKNFIWRKRKRKNKNKNKKKTVQAGSGSIIFDGSGGSGGSGSGVGARTNNKAQSRVIGGVRATTLREVFDSIERALGVTKKELFKIELQVFAELDFDLAVPPEHLLPHFVRLLDRLELTPREYLGEKLMRNYFQYDEDDEDEDVVVVTVERLGDEDDFMSMEFAPDGAEEEEEEEEGRMMGEDEIVRIEAFGSHSEYGASMTLQ